MEPSVHRFLVRHCVSAVDAVEADVELYRGMSPDERAVHLDAACRLAAEAVAASPWRDRILAHREPPHPAWHALIRRSRRGG